MNIVLKLRTQIFICELLNTILLIPFVILAGTFGMALPILLLCSVAAETSEGTLFGLLGTLLVALSPLALHFEWKGEELYLLLNQQRNIK